MQKSLFFRTLISCLVIGSFSTSMHGMCAFTCLSEWCCSTALPLFVEVGEVVIEKTAVVFFHTQLTKLQNEHKEAFLVLHQICNGDVSGLTDDIQEVLVQHHLMNEDGTVEKILKGFIAAMVTIEGSHSTSGSSGNSDSKKPTEKTGLMPQPKITSIQDALKSGTLKAHRKE